MLRGFGATDAIGQTYFAIFYSEVPTGNVFRTTVCRVSITGGLEWAHNFSLELPPSDATYFPESQDLSILLKRSAVEKRLVTLDKSGKRLP